MKIEMDNLVQINKFEVEGYEIYVWFQFVK